VWQAVVSQPLNQRIHTKAPGKLDKEAGEFWLANPWDVGEHNLSAFERNRILLNVPLNRTQKKDGSAKDGSAKDGSARRFICVSHPAGADIDSDSRAVATGDFNGDGMPDVVVRSSGGGPLRIFENRWPQTNWVSISLRGVQSNSRGLGAKVHIEAGGKSIWRELYPVFSFMSQQPSRIDAGLGNAKTIDRLTVHWPSGRVQKFTGVAVNRRLTIQEDEDTLANAP